MKTAHIISIGNELLIGDTVNTNASWLGRYLNEQGFEVEQVVTLPDSYDMLMRRMRESFNDADFTIVTGGAQKKSNYRSVRHTTYREQKCA